MLPGVVYFCAAAFVITDAPPLLIAVMICDSVSTTVFRSGPIVPSVAAAFSVWQSPQVVTNVVLPVFGLPTTLVDPWATAAAGTPAPSASAAARPRALFLAVKPESACDSIDPVWRPHLVRTVTAV